MFNKPEGTVPDQYIPRLSDSSLADLLTDLPALSLVGPRACGKTTTALRLAKGVARLDRPQEAQVFELDVDAALARYPEPALLDEWQEVPQVLGAVKRAVDENFQPARFILTGSVRAELSAATWPGTGRVVRVTMHPLTERELTRAVCREWFTDKLYPHDNLLDEDYAVLSIDEYIQRVVRGGFPAVVHRSARSRRQWLSSYLKTCAERDIPQVQQVRDPVQLLKLIKCLGSNIAGLPTISTLANSVGLNHRTTNAYLSALEATMLLNRVPAWHSNRLKRLSKQPKFFFADTSLAAAALGVTEADVLKDAELTGRFIENFVYHQIVSELSASAMAAELYHFRDRDGREIDLVIEFPGDALVGIEVKASASPTKRDARHLEWLRDQLGDAFRCGVVLHSGVAAVQISDRIYALPISALWH